MMDVVSFGGSCAAPPEGILSIEYEFSVIGPQTAGLLVRIRFWDTYDPSAPAPAGVVRDPLGVVELDYGFLSPNSILHDIVTLDTDLRRSDNIAVEWNS